MTAARAALVQELVDGIPYLQFLGLRFAFEAESLTGILPFDDGLIGNPLIPALHGGVTAAFLEATAMIALVCEGFDEALPPKLPKTIDLTVDYLRAGAACDAFASARVLRAGRRYASVQVEAWQDNRARPFAQANCHFLMPR